MRVSRQLVARVGGVLLLASAAVLFGGTQKAEAAFIAAICDDAACTGGGDVIVTDNGAGDALNAQAGIIVASGTVDGMEINLNVAQSKPIFGTAGEPKINLSYSLNNLVGGPANVYLYAGDTDFTGSGAVHLAVNSTTPGQDTVGMALGGDNNVVGANGLNLNPLLATVSANGVFSDVVTSAFTVPTISAPYALTAGVSVLNASLGAHTGDITITVPEPATMSLFGLGLFSAAMAARRRKNQANVA